jgi:hypothetical protein
MRSRQQKVTIQSNLFDMFGINQERGEVVVTPCVEQEGNKRNEVAEESPKEQQPDDETAAEKISETHDIQRRPPRRRNSRRMQSFRSNLTSSSSKQVKKSMASEDIYNAHLDAYLDGLAEDHHLGLRDDDDSFDIFHDPEEDIVKASDYDEGELNDYTHGGGSPPIIEIDIQLNVMNESLNDDDLSQCRSVVSEITVPAIMVNREA